VLLHRFVVLFLGLCGLFWLFLVAFCSAGLGFVSVVWLFSAAVVSCVRSVFHDFFKVFF
jgi:hypothetical protein